MKSMAFIISGLALAGLAIAFAGATNSTPMQDKNQPPSKEIKLAKTGWKLPAGHKTEWAIFGSG